MILRVDSLLTMGLIIAFPPMSVHYSSIRHLGYERLHYIPQGKEKTDRGRKRREQTYPQQTDGELKSKPPQLSPTPFHIRRVRQRHGNKQND